MKFSILSLFPTYFESPFNVSMLKRARDHGLIEINLVDIRDFAEGKHQTVDDRPYGGGPGMVLKPGPVVEAIQHARSEGSKVIYLSPQGKVLTAKMCKDLAEEKHLVIVCGHYEGIDERAIALEVDEEISIGDYVITSGAPAAIVLVDAVARFVPGVIGHPDAAYHDSYEKGIFDHPHYTRPPEFKGLSVPEVLLNGNHSEIETWRRKKALEKTQVVRPDLVKELEGCLGLELKVKVELG